MAAPVDPRIMAKVLVDAMFQGGDAEAARINKISTRTVRRYREKFNAGGPDSELSALVLQLLEKRQIEWSKQIDPAIADGIAFLRRAFLEANHENPHVIAEITKAIAMLSESQLTKRVIESRITSSAQV